MSPAATLSSSSFLITENEHAQSTTTASTDTRAFAFITRFNAREPGIVRGQRAARRDTSWMLETLVAFVAVSAVVICTPGQDTALTIRNTLSGGRRSGVSTAAGVAAGQAVWTVAASAGIVALLTASEPVFRTLKLVGAAYLVYLGVQSLFVVVRGRGKPRPYVAGAGLARPSSRKALREGLFSNLG